MATDGPDREPNFRKKTVLLLAWIGLSAVLLLGAVLWQSPHFGPAQSFLTVFSGSGMSGQNLLTEPLDINTATAAELEILPGIGEVLAGRIVDYRETNGFFSSPEDLLNVDGIGPKTLESILPYIIV